MSKSVHGNRQRIRQLEKSFSLDGNSLTFKAPRYQPLLDNHLKPFFFNMERLKLLKRNRLINRKFEVIDHTITKHYRNDELMKRPFHSTPTFKGSQHSSTLLSTAKESRTKGFSKGPIASCFLSGFEITQGMNNIRSRKVNKINCHTQPHKNISEEAFRVFLDKEKSKIKIVRERWLVME